MAVTSEVKQTGSSQAETEMPLWLACLILFGMLAGGVYWLWNVADASGYISHKETAQITVSPDWMVGETKACSSPVLTGRDAITQHRSEGYALDLVVCGDAPVKTFEVMFYGAQEQPRNVSAQWACTRNQTNWADSTPFTCKQTGAFRLR